MQKCSKSLGVESKLLPWEVFLKPHIARPDDDNDDDDDDDVDNSDDDDGDDGDSDDDLAWPSIPSIRAMRAAFSPIDLGDVIVI